MRVREFIKVLKENGVVVGEWSVRDGIRKLLKLLSDEELNKVVQQAIIEENDWLATQATRELLRRRENEDKRGNKDMS